MKNVSILMWVAVIAALTGCAAEAVKGHEGDVPLDGKLDSFRSPTDHGAIAIGAEVQATLARGSNFHTWQFELNRAATVRVNAAAARGGDPVDTVAYLYKANGDGQFGAYIHRNDDVSAEDSNSRIEAELTEGTYRILVKSYSGTDEGNVTVKLECASDSCVARATRDRCIFGEGLTFGDAIALRRVADHEVEVQAELEYVDELDSYLKSQIVVAAQLHNPRIENANQALEYTGPISVLNINDIDTRADFVGFVWERGGMTEGAILYAHSELAAKVVNGRVSDCAATEPVPAGSCGDLTSTIASECQGRNVGECLEELYPGTYGGPASFAAQCCVDEGGASAHCAGMLGDLSTNATLQDTIEALRGIERVKTFSHTGGSPADEADLLRIHEYYAHRFGDACEGLQPTWEAELEEIAADDLADNITSELENVSEYSGLDEAEVGRITTYLHGLEGARVYKAGVGDQNCETWGDLVFMVPQDRAEVTVVMIGSGS